MANKGSTLATGQYLVTGDYLVSRNGKYFAIIQSDGNFVLYRGSGPGDNQGYIWSISHTALPTGQYFAIMQSDGNFVLYRGSGPGDNQGYIWSISHTALPTGQFMAVMQDDGNFVVYHDPPSYALGPDGNLYPVNSVWASNTSWVSQRVTGKGNCLQTNQWLAAGDYLVSNNGLYGARMQDDGNFVVYYDSGGKASWTSNTVRGKGQYFARMQDDGNFVLYNGSDPDHSGGAYWASNTAQSQKGMFTAVMQDDGNFVVCPGSDPLHMEAALWASHTEWVSQRVTSRGNCLLTNQWLAAGDYLVSNNGLYGARMQSDGNFVLYYDSGARASWTSNTVRGQGQYFARMQDDGNFVLYHGSDPDHSGGAYWASNTNQGSSGGHYVLVMQDDGNLVLYPGSDPAHLGWPALWASNTWWVSRFTSGVNCLQTNQWFANDTYLVSSNGKFAAYLQGDDGNLVIFPTTPTSPPTPDFSKPLWSIYGNASYNLVGTAQGGKYFARMQDDGNFVLYNGSDPDHSSGPYWASNTVQSQRGNFVFSIEDSSVLMICRGMYPDPNGDVLWRFFPYSSWMEVMAAHIENKPLYQLVIPGTHDSGTYGLDPTWGFSRDSDRTADFLDPGGTTTLAWAKAQDRDIPAQLQSGIRFLDFRVEGHPNPPTPPAAKHGGPVHPVNQPWQQRIKIVHSLYGPTIEVVLNPVEQFLAAHTKEIVFLYFSTNVGSAMSADAWDGLGGYVSTLFQNRLVPSSLGTSVTPNALWAQGYQVIVIWEDRATADKYGFWFEGDYLDKIWCSPENPSLDDVRTTLQSSLEGKTDKKFSLTACAIGATTTLIEAGKFPNIDSSNLGHPTSLRDVAQQVTPAAMDWVKNDWAGLPLNIVTSDFYEIGSEVDIVLSCNTMS